tara:strand:+ start:248 stop:499 length:252 start_codon:yes stop_codon:yes gene_type:complete
MENIFLNEKEISELKDIQKEESEVITQLGQIEYKIVNLQDQKNLTITKSIELNQKRNLVAKNLQDKYGEGSIDIDTGEFIKNS